MTISFSGLASGLDTSSWVESLVALKQAKIDTLEEEKETVLLSQETLNNIKSFFTSFRGVIEKVTDAKFGIATMDLFAQNLASSADLDVLTATATTEAEEAEYNVLVDQLASGTAANSNFSYMTTIIQTTTASANSKLINLGVKAGNIGVFVNGVERGITITENDTVQSFVDKLNNIGVNASYNEKTGLFSMDIDANAINDIDNTGIVDAFHLEGVNEGYESNSLNTSTTDTIFSAATQDTTLSELGVKNGVITVNANDADYYFTINSNTTLGDIIKQFNDNNIYAALSEDGYFIIQDAKITNEGSTNFSDALGLVFDVFSNTQISGDLSHKSIITQTTTATSDTLIADLGDGINISNGQTVIVKNSNNEYATITVGTSTTIGDFLANLSNAGLYAAINDDGTIEISGGTITGGSFDAINAFGLKTEPYTAMTTGKPLTETIQTFEIVTLDTMLVDDLKVRAGYLQVTDADGNIFYEKIYHGQTLADFMADLGNLGIYTKLRDDGVLEITGGAFDTLSDDRVKELIDNGTIREADPRYQQGSDILTCLYGAPVISTDQITVASTYSKSQALTHSVTNTILASKSTTLGNLGMYPNGTAIFNVRGQERTINVTQSDSIQNLCDKLLSIGIEATFDDDTHRITIQNATLTGGSSNLDDILQLTETISGKYVTSDPLSRKETLTIEATLDSKLAEFGISNSMSSAQRTVDIFASDGSKAASFTVNENTTIADLINFINNINNIHASFNDGILKIENGYIKNATLENAMGLEESNLSSFALGSIMTITTISAVTGDTTLGEIIQTLNTQDKVQSGYSLRFNSQELNVNANTTLNELITMIHDKGGSAFLDATGRLNISGGTLSGTVASALGITSVTTTDSVSATGNTLYTTQEVFADLNTKMSDLGLTGNSTVIINDKLNKPLKTINIQATNTIEDLFNLLKNEGIDGTIANGVISLSSLEGKFITGSLPNHLGITTQSTTEVINTTSSSTAAITYTGTFVANLNSTLGDIGAIKNPNDNIVIFDNKQNPIGTINNLTTSSTIQDLFNELAFYDIQASITDGIISLYSANGNYATGNIMTNLGISVQNANPQTHTVAQTITSSIIISYTSNITATGDTLITEFATMSSSGTSNIIVYNDNKTAISTITLNSTSTLDDLFNALAANGIQAGISNGVISMTSPDGYYVTGNLLDQIGIGMQTITVTNTVGMTSSSTVQITHTDNINATGDTLITEFATMSSSGTSNIIVYNDNKTAISTITLNSTSTLDDLFNALAANGIQAGISNGVISMTSPDGYYVTGNLLDQIGIGMQTITVTNTVGMTSSSTVQITHTDNINATGDTLITEFATMNSSGTSNIIVYDDNKKAISTITLNATSTLDDLFNALAANGIQAGISNGVISMSSPDGYYVAGNILTQIGIGMQTITVTNTVGMTASSTVQVTHTQNITATGDTLITEFATMNSSGTSNIIVYNDNRTAVSTITLNSTSTLDDLFNALAANGIQAGISNGVISMTSQDGYYVAGNILTQIGIGMQTITVTNTVGMTSSSTVQITHTDNINATGDTLITEFATMNSSGTSNIIVYNDNRTAVSTITLNSTSTLDDLFNALAANGIQAGISNGVISMTSQDGYYVAGNILTQIGVGVQTITVTNTVGMTASSTTQITYTDNIAVTEDSLVSVLTQANYADGTQGKIDVKNQNGDIVGTVTVLNNSTFADMFDELAKYGIDASIVNGIIHISSPENNYIVSGGGNADLLSLMNIYTKTIQANGTIGLVATSGSAITYTDTVLATENSLISDVIDLNLGNTLIVNSKNNKEIATITVSNSTTFEQLMNSLKDNGIDSKLINGVLSLQPQDGQYVTGDVADALGINAIKYIGIGNSSGGGAGGGIVAGGDKADNAVLGQLGYFLNATTTINIKSSDGFIVASQEFYATASIQDLIKFLNDNNVGASIQNDILVIDNSKGFYAEDATTGGLLTQIGVKVTTQQSTTASFLVEVTKVVDNDAISISELVLSSSGFLAGHVYTINSVTEYKAFVDLINASANKGSGATFILTSDITLQNSGINSVNYTIGEFAGTFYGNGHVITSNRQGYLFGTISASGTISDLGVKNLVSSHFSSIARYNTGGINNCYFESTENMESYIVGQYGYPSEGGVGNDGIITNCYVKSTDAGSSINSHPTHTRGHERDCYVGNGSGITFYKPLNGTNTGSENLQDIIDNGILIGGAADGGIAVGSDTMGNIINFGSSEFFTINVKNSDGDIIASQVFHTYSTIDELIHFLNSNGIDTYMSGGVLYLDNKNEIYAEDAAPGGMLSQMQISTTTKLTTTSFLTVISTVTASNATPISFVTELVQNNTYTISTTDEYKKFIELANDYYASSSNNSSSMHGIDCTIVLTKDLNFNGQQIDTIREFNGVFAGNGHKISNISLYDTDSGYRGIGLFICIEYATIQDLGIENINVIADDTNYSYIFEYIGAIAGRSNGSTINNCYVKNCSIKSTFQSSYSDKSIGTIVGSGNNSTISNVYTSGFVDIDVTFYNSSGSNRSNIGGIAGDLQGQLSNVFMEGNINISFPSAECVGGMVGSLSSSTTISNLAIKSGSNLNIISTDRTGATSGDIGGYFGYVGGTSLSNLNLSNITGSIQCSSHGYVGGIVGRLNNGSISNCHSELNIININTGTYNSGTGGIVGYLYGASITQSSVNADIEGANYVGGIVGIAYSVQAASNLEYSGNITLYGTGIGSSGYSSAYGGIIADANNQNIVISNCKSSGSINSLYVNNLVGGIIGNSYAGTIKNCSSEMNIDTNGDLIGGIVGGIDGNLITIDNCYSTGDIHGSGRTGGILGANQDTAMRVGEYSATIVVSNSYSTGDISSDTSYAGGIVGMINMYYQETASINNCYATGDVFITDALIDNSGTSAGGLIGYLYLPDDSKFSSTTPITPDGTYTLGFNTCYFSGEAYGGQYNGGIIGNVDGQPATTLTPEFSSSLVYNSDDNAGAIGYIRSIGYRPDPISLMQDNTTGLSYSDMCDQTTMEGYGFTADKGWTYETGEPPKLNITSSGRTTEVTENVYTFYEDYVIVNTDSCILYRYYEAGSGAGAGGSGGGGGMVVVTITMNSTSDLLSHADELDLSTATLFELLGLGEAESGYVTVVSDGTEHVVTIKSTDTIDDLISTLGGFDIAGSVHGGKLTLVGGEQSYVEGMSQNVKDMLDFTTGEGETYVSGEGEYVVNTESKYLEEYTTVTMSTSSTLDDLGMTGTAYVTVRSSGTQYVVTVTGDTTVDDLISTLAGYGISGGVNNGKLTFTGTDEGYILGMTNTLSNALKLKVGANNTYKTETDQLYFNDDSNKLSKTETVTMSTSSTLDELGMTGTAYVTVRSSGTQYIVTVTGDTTVDDLISTLAGFGISGSVNNGRLTFTGTDEGYILGMTTTLSNALKLRVGANNTYRTETDQIYYNDDSNRLNKNVTVTMSTSSTLESLGLTSNAYVTVRSNGTQYVVTVRGDTTVDDLISTLAGYGISGSVNNGRLTFTGTDEGYILGMTTTLSNALKLKVGANNTYRTETDQIYYNDDSNRLNKNVTVTMSTSSTLESLGLTSNAYVTVRSNGTQYVVTVTGDTTVDDLISTLAGYGISGSVNNGRLTFTGTDEGYILGMTTTLSNALKLKVGANNTYRTETDQIYYNDDSNRLNKNVTVTMSTSSTLESLGLTSNAYVTVRSNGTQYVVTVTGDTTVDDLISTLAGYGISGSVNNGRLTFTGTDEGYILGMTTTLSNALKLKVGANNTYRTETDQIYYNDDSNRLNKNKVVTLSTSTTMEDLGVNSNGTITVHSDGTNHVVTITPDKTVDDIISTLAGYGIAGYVNNGRLSFDGEGGSYIVGISSNISNALALKAGENNSWTTEVEKTWINTDSNYLSYEDDDVRITGDTVLSSINGFNNGNGKLVVHQIDGRFVTITVNASDTVSEFFTQISRYGLVGNIDSDGRVSIEGVGNVYLQAVSGGSNILTSMKMSNVVYNVQTVTVNRTSNVLSQITTVAASGSTQLGNLADQNGNTMGSGNGTIILQTTSDAGNQHVTLTFSRTQSIYDVIDKLSEYGIQAILDASGRFSMSSSTLTDFEISGNLGQLLMGSYTKDYGTSDTYNISTNLVETTVGPMTPSTLLSTFGIRGGNILITQQGVNYTVNIDTTQLLTVSDFMNFLAEYGFSSEIDAAGRLAVSGIGESYLTSLSGGSNILDVFGLTDWDMGTVTQTSDHLEDKETIVHETTLDTRLNELTDAAGNNLGITSGSIYVYQDGTRYQVSINNNDTLQTLAAKLSQYGISMELSSDGSLYFEGTNNSYMTTSGITSGASNILQKLNIQDWSERYDSTSGNLSYTVEVDNVVTGSTKLSDLQDASGNNLGITEGTFYVYNSGVRNTETITADMTVNDLKALLAEHGLIVDISENGQISVGAYNNSYLATSALSGQNSNIVSTLFAEWDFVNIYTSNNLEIPEDVVVAVDRDTKLSDINEGVYQPGFITVVKDGVQTNIELTADDTIGTLMDELALYGFETVLNDNGQLIIKNTGNSLLQNYTGSGQASNALTLLGIDLNNWVQTNNYESSTLNVVTTTTIDAAITMDTELSLLGVTTGEYYIYNNGVKYTAYISTGETMGSFLETLKSFGIETSLVSDGDSSILTIIGNGDSYITKSSSTTNSSNVVEQLFGDTTHDSSYSYSGLEQTSEIVTTTSAITEETLLNYFDTPWGGSTLKAEGSLSVTVNDENAVIEITADETFGSLISKFEDLGLEASITSDGQLIIQSGFDTFTINNDGTTSSLLATIGLKYNQDLGGFAASSQTTMATTTEIEERTLSVANYAGFDTEMGLLNISDGTLSIYRDGEKATIDIHSDETFTDLRSRIAASFADVDITFEDGYLKFYSKDGHSVEVGSTTDTSNFSAITGLSSNGEGAVVSARELYSVNSDSVITHTGLFRRGDVTEGTFIIGNATFSITDKTTLADIISQINSSDEANATAYWDSIQGKFVIQARTTGSSLINIEAGTSNFTDIMGYTNTTWEADGDVDTTKMNVNTQEVGKNAVFSINGTTYTSASNTITSDISRIKGVTINLKGLTEGSAVKLTVERDKETLATAISDVVDAYNELISNVDEAIAIDGELHDQSLLKLIRNQLRTMMTASDAGTTIFRNLDSIGISVDSASANNISTEGITELTFDKDKFIQAFEADEDAVKALLIGSDSNTGIFTKIETLLESTLQSVTGYFASADDSYQREIQSIDNKIDKQQRALERYRAQLEAKFASMDILIANMQQQYSSFLVT